MWREVVAGEGGGYWFEEGPVELGKMISGFFGGAGGEGGRLGKEVVEVGEN